MIVCEGIDCSDIVGFFVYLGLDCIGVVSVLFFDYLFIKWFGYIFEDYDLIDDEVFVNLVEWLVIGKLFFDELCDLLFVVGVRLKILFVVIFDGKFVIFKKGSGVLIIYIFKLFDLDYWYEVWDEVFFILVVV